MKFSKNILLLVLIILGASQSNIIQSVNPGIELQLTEVSLNNFTDKIIDLVQNLIVGLQIPDIQFEKDSIKVSINNGSISDFEIDQNQTKFVLTPEDELNFIMVLKDIQIDFEYEVKELFIKVSDLGKVNIEDIEFQFDVDIENNEGKIYIDPVNIEVTKGEILIDLGDSVVKDAAAELLQQVLQHYLTDIEAQVSSIIVDGIKSLDDIIPDKIDIAAIKTTFDLSLVADPVVENQTLIIQLNGAFYPMGGQPLVLNPSTPFLDIQGDNSTKVYIHQDVINSLFDAALANVDEVAFAIPGGIGSTSTANSMTLVPFFPAMAKYIPYQDWQKIGFQLNNLVADLEVKEGAQSLDVSISANLGLYLEPVDVDLQYDIILNSANYSETQGKSLYNFLASNMDVLDIKYKQENEQQQKQEDSNRTQYAENINFELSLSLGLLQQDNTITIQGKSINVNEFQPTQQDMEEGKFDLIEFDNALTYMLPLGVGALNGSLLYNSPIDIAQILGTSIDEFKIAFGDQYIALLIDL